MGVYDVSICTVLVFVLPFLHLLALFNLIHTELKTIHSFSSLLITFPLLLPIWNIFPLLFLFFFSINFVSFWILVFLNLSLKNNLSFFLLKYWLSCFSPFFLHLWEFSFCLLQTNQQTESLFFHFSFPYSPHIRHLNSFLCVCQSVLSCKWWVTIRMLFLMKLTVPKRLAHSRWNSIMNRYLFIWLRNSDH